MQAKPPHDFCRDPFEHTLDAIISGDATAKDQVILNDTLRLDPDARRRYIETIAFEAMLAREFAPTEETPTVKAAASRNWRAPLAVAAAIALGATLAWKFHPTPQLNTIAENTMVDTEIEITHAVISSLEDAQGRIGTTALSQGMRLAEGVLELDSGLAEITFDTGAEVTLEGPARLQLESENKTRLAIGRASARVPEQARGFVIHTPSSYIRDLGTEFAVEVHENHETDLHVLEGEVEVAATGRLNATPPKILRQKQAVRVAAGKMLPISFKSDSPGQRRKSRNHKIPPSVHWSFDEWTKNTTTDSARGHRLTLRRKNSSAAPQTPDGPFGKALHLDGNGLFARSDFPGVPKQQSRTVACWVRIQPDASDTQNKPVGIVSWGVKRSSENWQLTWNRTRGQGNVGAPRIEFGGGFVVGSTDLRDGRWHHIAVICLGGPKANVESHVRIYLDGRLEAISGRRKQPTMHAPEATGVQPVTIGRYIGRDSSFFEGDIDEVHIFEGALLPSQIQRLIKRNTAANTKP